MLHERQWGDAFWASFGAWDEEFELEFGAHLRDSARPWAAVRGFLGGLEVLPLTEHDTDAAARVAADLRRRGRRSDRWTRRSPDTP